MFKAPKERRILPGFGLSMGFTVCYLCLLVLFPLAGLLLKTLEISFQEFWQIITNARVIASFKLSFSTAIFAGAVNVVFGMLVAWVLVRYKFPGRRLIDGLIDLPFALPTAVAGIALTSIYSQNGVVGRFLYGIGIQSAFSPLGITIALVFIGLPFVVRTVQPVLQGVEREWEEAAMSLGARRWRIFRSIILPEILPALLTGFTLALARGIGEYGSVVFISGNMPMRTEIAPLLIMTKLEQYDYAGATAIALVMLVVSFGLLLCIHYLQWRIHRRRATSI